MDDAHPELRTPAPTREPESEAEGRLRRSQHARALAGKAQDAGAREALEVIAANWESLARHLARRPAREPAAAAPASSRKAQARSAALGLEG